MRVLFEQKLRRAALLSNSAIEYFQKEDYLPAVSQLTTALAAVKELMGVMESDPSAFPSATLEDQRRNRVICVPSLHLEEHQQSGESMDISPSPSSCEPSSPGCTALHQQNLDNDGDVLAKWDPRSSSERLFVYKTPFRILDDVLHERCLDYRLLSEISIVIMFNLALCHHMRGLCQLSDMLNRDFEDKSEQVESFSKGSVRLMFHQAIVLYELAYEVQVQEKAEIGLECAMATVNNLGRIHQVRGDTKKASRCFSHLLSTLLFIRSTASCGLFYGHNESQWAASQQSTEGFLETVSHLILKKQAAEAA